MTSTTRACTAGFTSASTRRLVPIWAVASEITSTKMRSRQLARVDATIIRAQQANLAVRRGWRIFAHMAANADPSFAMAYWVVARTWYAPGITPYPAFLTLAA